MAALDSVGQDRGSGLMAAAGGSVCVGVACDDVLLSLGDGWD